MGERPKGEGPRDDRHAAQQIRMKVDGRRVIVLAAADGADHLEKLTESERSVALLAAEGLDNAQIAERRSRSVRTVANQLASVYKKLGISSREQLVQRLAGDAE